MARNFGNSSRRQFSRNVGGDRRTQLYKWSPWPHEPKQVNKSNRPYFCSPISNPAGEDWIVTYVYELIVVRGIAHRYGYVECDYVE